MKYLRYLLYFVLALVALFLIIALMAPKVTTVERTIEINAPASMVYEQINSLEDMDKWSPWKKADPNVEFKYTGESGKVGSEYYWSGNDEIGEGTQTITSIEEGKGVNTKLNFVRPWPGEADASVTIKEDRDSVTVASWGFQSETAFPMNISNLFINMDKMLGPQYEEGLANLKKICEEGMQGMEVEGYKMELKNIGPRFYLGVKDRIPFDKMDQFFRVTMAKVGGAMGKLGILEEAVTSTIYYVWDEENKETKLLAGMYADKDMGDVLGMDTEKIPTGTAIITEYNGDYDQGYAVHTAMEKYLKMTGYKSTGMCMEDYVVGPGVEDNPAKWITRVVYPLVK